MKPPKKKKAEPVIYGPHYPPMIKWQREKEPGWPFNHAGGPLPGTINYRKGEQLELPIA